MKALKCPRLNLFETFNVIAIKLVVILNHFPGDKTVFYVLYLTLVFVVTVQSGNIAHIRILMVMHDSFKSITAREKLNHNIYAFGRIAIHSSIQNYSDYSV